MLRSRPCRGAIGFIAATLVVAQGCYVYRPTTLPIPDGAGLRVEGAPLEIYEGTVIRPVPADCRATQLYADLHYARGDTLVVGPVLGVRHASPRRACQRLVTATLVATPATTTVSVRQFSAGRTTLLVGAVATVALVAFFVELGQSFNFGGPFAPVGSAHGATRRPIATARSH